MRLEEVTYYYSKFKFGEDNYHNLMKNKINEILLVSTFYDAFIFEQDGRLSEQIYGEYRQLNLSTAPRITSVPTGEGALRLLERNKFDLVIVGMSIGDISPFEFARRCKQKYHNVPVLLLINVGTHKIIDKFSEEMQYIDNVFIWQGDSKIFLAMVKYIEDRRNAEYDTRNGLVRIILLVEDNISFYSRYLPLLYDRILRQTQHLISQELNDMNKRLRMRARPKVILVHSYEEAIEMYERFKDYMIALISDVSFPYRGEINDESGIKLIKYIKRDNPGIPVILQSSEESNRQKADELGIGFLNKQSKVLLQQLQEFILKNLGFGDFIFYNDKMEKISRARSLNDFECKLAEIPNESLVHHSQHNDFSSWLYAHGEFGVATEIQSIKVEDFTDINKLRTFLLDTFHNVRNRRNRGKIINFAADVIDQDDCVVRLSEGSLGGKGRGIAFLNALLVSMDFDEKYPDVYIRIPTTFIIGTTEFDEFIENNEIPQNLNEYSDAEINLIFINGKLSGALIRKLRQLIDKIDQPLAIRSSGLLEDSQAQPFAGVYQTYMLPNNHPEIKARLKQLTNAIKLVYASVFSANTCSYIEGINYAVEEEKMAVIIQEIGGSKHGNYFYPHLSGVAQSYNFYTTAGFAPHDGIASVALGLGKTVVEGGKTLRFVPAKPKKEILREEELARYSQKEFYAINLEQANFDLLGGEGVTYAQLGLKVAEEHGTIKHLASVWDYQNNRYSDGLYAKGPRIISFANILKHNVFPLAAIVHDVLDIGETAMGAPVEIEFAADLTKNTKKGIRPNFYLLQIRPLTVNQADVTIDKTKLNMDDLFIYTEKGLGNGILRDIDNVIYIDSDDYDNTQTRDYANEVSELNNYLKEKKEKCVLIAPGRWGTSDRFLGIPVRWDQINTAGIVVEVTKENYSIDASQGTHFFHNLISQGVGYFAIPHSSDVDFISWNWLKALPATKSTKSFKLVKLPSYANVKLDGTHGIGAIWKC